MRPLYWDFMIQNIWVIAQGIPYSLEIAVVALFFGFFIGLITAIARMYKVPVLCQISSVYIAIIRGTPLLIQILISYYGIPRLLLYINYIYHLNFNINNIPPIFFVFFCFSIYTGSYLSETIRGCILSVDPGQMEACYSVGMTTAKGMMRVVLPQAMISAVPNIANQFIGLIKDASLAFVIAIPEILGQAKIVAGRSSKFLEAYIVAAAWYFIICWICQRFINIIEKRINRQQKKA